MLIGPLRRHQEIKLLLPSATKLRRLCFYTYLSVHRGGLPQCMLGYHPPWPGTTPPRDQAHTPRPGTPPRKQTPPREQTPPADGYCSRRYASYWNAFLLPPTNVVCEGYIFTGVCDSVNRGGVRGFIRGACMVLFGGHAWFYSGGHAWFYSGGHAWFDWGDMRGFIWRGWHAWFYSGGMRGFIWGGVRGFFSFFGYNEIRSMSGRYASYWNAFLF